MQQFRSILILLLILSSFTYLTGCLENEGNHDFSVEPYKKYFEIKNETDEAISVEYISDIDEAYWAWESDEYIYSIKEIAPNQKEYVEILITDYNESDILTFIKGSIVDDLIGTWREAITIEVSFDEESQDLKFTYY